MAILSHNRKWLLQTCNTIKFTFVPTDKKYQWDDLRTSTIPWNSDIMSVEGKTVNTMFQIKQFSLTPFRKTTLHLSYSQPNTGWIVLALLFLCDRIMSYGPHVVIHVTLHPKHNLCGYRYDTTPHSTWLYVVIDVTLHPKRHDRILLTAVYPK